LGILWKRLRLQKKEKDTKVFRKVRGTVEKRERGNPT